MNLNYITEDIKRSFANHFLKWQLLLEDAVIDGMNTHVIKKEEWEIRFIENENADGKYLEFYAISSMYSDSHFRIYQNGVIEELDVILEHYSYDETLPGNKEIQKEEYLEQNKVVYEYLKENGLYRI